MGCPGCTQGITGNCRFNETNSKEHGDAVVFGACWVEAFLFQADLSSPKFSRRKVTDSLHTSLSTGFSGFSYTHTCKCACTCTPWQFPGLGFELL
mmetsp:Transcript_103166/g.183328  ORF Transcript_103166/g.183328 Transcript_103166/m.183328 type:complete len:95 (-) Transcript_103166:49-333(-)